MNEKKTILIDSHVHIHDCYDIEEFFGYAFSNFKGAYDYVGLANDFVGVLFLTEAGEYNFFKKLFNGLAQLRQFKYEILRTREDNSLIISNRNNIIVLIAGQQIVSGENLEVLALGTTNRLEYGKNISDTINEVIKIGALPVVPWGVGKWLGKREQTVQELIKSRRDFFLGDNGNRPSFWKKPAVFRLAEERGIFNLPGSDPLSFKTEVNKAGGYGFYFSEVVDMEYPAKDLKEKIVKADKQFNVYGKLENAVNFFRNQTKIQVSRKLRGKQKAK